MENREKMVLKTLCFFDIDFSSLFFRFFAILARFWEAPGAQKINKKSKKSHSGRFWNAFGIQYRFWARFWTDFCGFCKELEWILEGFLNYFRNIFGRISGCRTYFDD